MKLRSWVVIFVLGMIAAGAGIAAHKTGFDILRRAGLVEQSRLTAGAYRPGDPVFIRIFKRENELELWHRSADRQWHLAKTYAICRWSGALGPKLREGDRQSPEGFYEVSTRSLNPQSSYHLSFNLGFPNALDRSLGRSGSFLMVHGGCVSIGCYAMTDAGIEEIYAAVEASLQSPTGQDFVPVHIFPWRFGSGETENPASDETRDFWANLRQGYDRFQQSRQPFDVFARDGLYTFDDMQGAAPLSRVGLKSTPSTG